MAGTGPSPCPPHPAAHTGWDSQGGFLIRFSLPPPSPIQRTGQGRVYCTLSWSQACAGFSHELADPTTALCYGGSQPQFTVEETQASRSWGIAQVTQLVSSRAPEPALPTWYCPAPPPLRLIKPCLCPQLASGSCWSPTLNICSALPARNSVYFCPYPSLKPLTPLSDRMSFNSPWSRVKFAWS